MNDPTELQDPSAPPARRSLGRRLRSWAMATAFAATVASSAVAGVLLLHHRASTAQTVDAREPLTVETQMLSIVDSYDVKLSYAGRIEPARETNAAFERAGLVVAVLVDEGDAVRSGMSLAQLDVAPLEIERRRLEAERRGFEADLQLARETEKRRDTLRGRGFESGQRFDEARFSAAAIEARIEAIDAQLDRIALDLAKSTLNAPFDGVIATRMIDEGAVVEAGAAVLSVQETSRPQARIGAPPEIAATLSSDAPLRVRTGGRVVDGALLTVTPDLDPTTRTLSLLIDLDPQVPVTMGDIARLEVAQTVAARGAWTPLVALRQAPRGLWGVQTVVGEGDAAQTALEVVEVLHVSGDRAFVRGSFADGARIVVSGPHRAAPRQPVALIDAQAVSRAEDLGHEGAQ